MQRVCSPWCEQRQRSCREKAVDQHGLQMPTARCWIGSDQYCQLSKRATKARPRAGPRRKRDSRVISVSALSRKPITATMRRHRSGTSPKKSLRQAVASISPELEQAARAAGPSRSWIEVELGEAAVIESRSVDQGGGYPGCH